MTKHDHSIRDIFGDRFGEKISKEIKMAKAHLILHRLADVKLRNVFFAFTVSLGMLMVISTYTLTDGLRKDIRLQTFDISRMFRKTEKKVVLLVTERRSGSTFLGKIFSHSDSFYLFEPLLPYTPNCDALNEERVRTLTSMLRCDFDNVSRDFKKAFEETGYPDNNAKCMDHTLCFVTYDRQLLARYWRLCNSLRNKTYGEVPSLFDEQSDECGYPLKPHILTRLCKEASMVAYKVVRLCSLKSIEPLYKELTREGHKVYIIHLVRDPRAVIASRLDVGLDGVSRTNAEEEIEELCNRSRENLEYIERKQAKIDEKEMRNARFGENYVSDGRYLRVRFEDFAQNSLQKARDIYSFIGAELPPSIEDWIKVSQFPFDYITRLAKQKENKDIQYKAKYILQKMVQPFSTTRDPWEVLTKWRYRLPLQFVQMTQAKCTGVFARMDYKIIQTPMELMNFSIPLY